MSNPLEHENILSFQSSLYLDINHMPLIVNRKHLLKLREGIAKQQGTSVEHVKTLYINYLADFMLHSDDPRLQGLALAACEHILNRTEKQNKVVKTFTCRLVNVALQEGLNHSRNLDAVLLPYIAHLHETLGNGHCHALQDISTDYALEILRYSMESRYEEPTALEEVLLALITNMQRYKAQPNMLYATTASLATSVLYQRFGNNNEYLYKIYQKVGAKLTKVHQELSRLVV